MVAIGFLLAKSIQQDMVLENRKSADNEVI